MIQNRQLFFAKHSMATYKYNSSVNYFCMNFLCQNGTFITPHIFILNKHISNHKSEFKLVSIVKLSIGQIIFKLCIIPFCSKTFTSQIVSSIISRYLIKCVFHFIKRPHLPVVHNVMKLNSV